MGLETLCVFCGSSAGDDPAYAAAARTLGRLLARRGVTLVYGGGSVGMMGALADAALAEGGRVVGVIPRFMADLELAHAKATEMHVVGSMHDRKALMARLSDAFAALPGGLGTLEELFEVWTWAQLGLHRKPMGLLNTAGYFDDLDAFLKNAAARGFLKDDHRRLVTVRRDPGGLLDRLGSLVRPGGRRVALEDRT